MTTYSDHDPRRIRIMLWACLAVFVGSVVLLAIFVPPILSGEKPWWTWITSVPFLAAPALGSAYYLIRIAVLFILHLRDRADSA